MAKAVKSEGGAIPKGVRLLIVPVAGARITVPSKRMDLPPEGMLCSLEGRDGIYLRRRIRDGDATWSIPTTTTTTKGS